MRSNIVAFLHPEWQKTLDILYNICYYNIVFLRVSATDGKVRFYFYECAVVTREIKGSRGYAHVEQKFI